MGFDNLSLVQVGGLLCSRHDLGWTKISNQLRVPSSLFNCLLRNLIRKWIDELQVLWTRALNEHTILSGVFKIVSQLELVQVLILD